MNFPLSSLNFLGMKRAVDLLFVLAALLLLWPLLLALAALIWMCYGWPVFFCQHRPGLRGRPFLMLKFRTMSESRGTDGSLLPDAQRLTRF